MLDIMARRIMHSRCNIESTQKLYSFVKNRRTYTRAFDLSRNYCVKAVKSTLAQLTVVYKHKATSPLTHVFEQSLLDSPYHAKSTESITEGWGIYTFNRRKKLIGCISDSTFMFVPYCVS